MRGALPIVVLSLTLAACAKSSGSAPPAPAAAGHPPAGQPKAAPPPARGPGEPQGPAAAPPSTPPAPPPAAPAAPAVDPHEKACEAQWQAQAQPEKVGLVTTYTQDSRFTAAVDAPPESKHVTTAKVTAADAGSYTVDEDDQEQEPTAGDTKASHTYKKSEAIADCLAFQGGGDVKAETLAKDQTQITVGAGTFTADHLKMHYTSSADDGSPIDQVTETWTLPPDGLILKVQTHIAETLNNQPYQEDTVKELTVLQEPQS